MVKKSIIEHEIYLNNIEISEYCILILNTGFKEFFRGLKKYNEIHGLYYKNETVFFALIETESGPQMYYEGKLYPLKPELHITLLKGEMFREFRIEEYNICINYPTSKYIGFDVWSTEMDVDLFYQIEQSYKNEEYYKKFTIKKEI